MPPNGTTSPQLDPNMDPQPSPNHLKTIPNPKFKRQFLINCLRAQGFITGDSDEYNTEELKEETDICKLCKSSSLIFTNHEAICNNCGTVTNEITANPFKTFKQDLNSGKGTFIEAGTINITVMKDGKPVVRDLAKVNTWVNTDPTEDKLRKAISYIIDVLDTLEKEYPPISFEKVKANIPCFFRFVSCILAKDFTITAQTPR